MHWNTILKKKGNPVTNIFPIAFDDDLAMVKHCQLWLYFIFEKSCVKFNRQIFSGIDPEEIWGYIVPSSQNLHRKWPLDKIISPKNGSFTKLN